MSIDHTTPPPTSLRTGTRARDVLTVLLLLGAALPLVLPWGLAWATATWLLGTGLLWSSPTWSTHDRALGTLVWPGGLIGPVLALTRIGQVCTQVLPTEPGQTAGDPTCTGFALDPWVGAPLSIILLAAPFAVAAVLISRSRSYAKP